MASLIEDYALLGDTVSAALVGRDGSIDWLCLPRFDSPACFAALLGGDQAGSWRIAPVGVGSCTTRRYRGDSLILESDWETDDRAVRVIDTMPPRGEAADVVRVVEGLRGRVAMTMTLRLRFDYGRDAPWIRRQGDQLVGIAGPDAVWLSTPVSTAGQDRATHADFTVAAGKRVPFVLTHADRRTFTQFYGSEGLDAALLLIPQVGFLPGSDSRVTGTVAAVQHELDHHGLLLRYRPELDGGVDGLAGGEGAFLACSFWLADALHQTGQTEQARHLFERLLTLRSDVGLLSEEYDPVHERHLGNTPQAFSHVGLINTARQLGRAPAASARTSG